MKTIRRLFMLLLICLATMAPPQCPFLPPSPEPLVEPPSDSQTSKLSDTGQTKCWDETGTEIPCAETGQDGAYIINPPSYTDNGNGTVTDNVTKLIWQKEDNGQVYNWFKAAGVSDVSFNPNSQSVCGELGTGWRLPSKKELMTTVDYSASSEPTINLTYFPNTKSWGYWTVTPVAQEPIRAWMVSYNGGFACSGCDGGKAFEGYYVRCVKGNMMSKANFINNQDGTITDKATGLTWQQEVGVYMNWPAALDYCNNLPLAGGKWRLPNVIELESTFDDDRIESAINTDFFSDAGSTRYWSSTTWAINPLYAYSTDFYGLVGYAFFDKHYYSESVRCVRSGGGEAEEAVFKLQFPLRGHTPYDAPVSAVFDHSGDASYSPDNQRVVAFTGEIGNRGPYRGSTCYGKANRSAFGEGFNYSGARSAGGKNYLCYDGHPGYDYKVANVTVYAAQAGIVNFPLAFPGISDHGNGNDAQQYNTLAIDHENDYITYYLHLSSRVVQPGEKVIRGQLIGYSGDVGSPGSYHLHFEVQKDGVPVDPYGWVGDGADPYIKTININLWE